MMRAVSIIAAIVSPFMFPAPLAIAVVAVAAFFAPFMAVAIGLLYDLLYLPTGAVPMGTIIGIIGTIVALLVRRFVETRIIGG